MLKLLLTFSLRYLQTCTISLLNSKAREPYLPARKDWVEGTLAQPTLKDNCSVMLD